MGSTKNCSHQGRLRYRSDSCSVECQDCGTIWAPADAVAQIHYLQTRVHHLESVNRDLKNQLGKPTGRFAWDGG